MIEHTIEVGDHVKWSYYFGTRALPCPNWTAPWSPLSRNGIVLKVIDKGCHYAVVDTGKVDGVLYVPYSVLELYK